MIFSLAPRDILPANIIMQTPRLPLRTFIVSVACWAWLALAATATQAAQIRVHYNTGWGNRITLRGNGGGLSWTTGKNATWTTGNVWVLSTTTTSTSFQFKPLVNDTSWSVGANYVAPPGNSVVDIYPFFGSQNGTLMIVQNFYSTHLGNYRDLVIYLPPSYNENTQKRYPVLYLHDGQNLFDASTAFGGVEWQVDETTNQLVRQGKMRELIIVGIENTAARMSEYTPEPDPDYGGGNGDAYLDFVELEVIPYINSSLRTQTGPANTYIGGSSLGGLISFYASFTRSDVFSAAVCMSSSFWWNNEALTLDVASHTGPIVPARFYIDAGGINDGAADTADMRDAMVSIGYTQGSNLFHWYEPGGSHSEASWAARFHIPMESLFPFQ